jgi:hypothetical protein
MPPAVSWPTKDNLLKTLLKKSENPLEGMVPSPPGVMLGFTKLAFPKNGYYFYPSPLL